MKTTKIMNRIALTVVAVIFAVSFGVSLHYAWMHKSDAKVIEELLIQQGKYERCLDSTCQYIYDKYEEYLPDTYWEGDVYQDIYEGAEDRDCWENWDGRNINK